MSPEALGYAMFQRRCELDDADAALMELAWLDSGVQDFWIAEAKHVLTVIRECEEWAS